MQIQNGPMAKGQEANFDKLAERDITAPLKAGARGKLFGWIAGSIIAVLIAVAIYLAGFAIFASHVAGLKTPSNPPKADAIIVLTGGQARLGAATALLTSGRGERLLISGVHPSTHKPALQRATGVQSEIFACCIDIDHAALDTIGNAVESSKWLTEKGFSSAIVVTNNYHIPRSMLELSRRAEGKQLVPYPVVFSDLANGGWLANPDALRVLFTEYGKYVMALIRGR